MTVGHIISVQRVLWRSFPSRRLWQSTKTGRRWGRYSNYRHPWLIVTPHQRRVGIMGLTSLHDCLEFNMHEPISSAFRCRRGAAFALRTDTHSSKFTSFISYRILFETACRRTPSLNIILAVILHANSQKPYICGKNITQFSQLKSKQTDLFTIRNRLKCLATISVLRDKHSLAASWADHLSHRFGARNWLDWIVHCFSPLQHSIGYMGDGFYRSKTQPTVSKYWGKLQT